MIDMLYINEQARLEIDCCGMNCMNTGELNYKITKLINDYITRHGGINYQRINDAIGVLECAKLELYRRVAAPYEDVKMRENGDVYTI